MFPRKRNTLDGTGQNRRGPEVVENFFKPEPGDGLNTLGAARPENIPAGMYLQVPPIGWHDSGVPGIFVRDKISPMYDLPKTKPKTVQLSGDLVYHEDGDPNPTTVSLSCVVQFRQHNLIEGLLVSNEVIHLQMGTIAPAKVIYILCERGQGTVSINESTPIIISAGFGFGFANFVAGINSVIFEGSLVVDVALFK